MTIAAISTNIGGPIGIIRISGDDAIEIADKIFTPNNGKKFSQIKPNYLTYGSIISRNNKIIDHPMAVYFKAPHSYTGENMVEFHLHGATSILQEILSLLFSMSVVSAMPGEFTKRAFINGKMNLASAEAVHDIITAKTTQAAENASAQVCGKFGDTIFEIRENLLDLVSHFHALVDYPDEDIDPFLFKKAEEVLHFSANKLYKLAESFEKGKIMKDGIPCTILGRPNAGKSSLMNALSGRDTAIVTNIPGTTRDLIEESIKIGPIILKLTDTAGLRETDNIVEKIGVEKALKQSKNASLILAVFDINQEINDEDLMVIAKTRNIKSIAIINKNDLEQKLDITMIEKHFAHIIFISTSTGDGLEKLFEKITELVGFSGMNFDGEIVTNARQAAVLTRAAQRAEEAFIAAQSGMTPDAVVMDAEGAICVLGEVTGQNVTDDVVSKIFENFCVGK